MKARIIGWGALAVALGLLLPGSAAAHCQVPCGIYDDAARLEAMREHVRTIAKAMDQVDDLSGGDDTPLKANQRVRWIMTKEDHAQQLQDVVTAYFMAQRLSPPTAQEGSEWQEYVRRLTLLHRIQVEAMKAKQTVDAAHVTALEKLIDEFQAAYLGEAANGHAH